MQESNPWWKEPWPWLLMSGPLLAIVACGVTIWLASTHPDRPVVESVARHGLVVEKMEGSSGSAKAPQARQP